MSSVSGAALSEKTSGAGYILAKYKCKPN
ncbi:hypothetical protein KL86SPO_20016 [uncultured Sporomusa sp.]|uniref:Uncharacterized protein n=1 Tax=uncultured Sporomusa sp. TaxID=307249 RepID=A0A212LLI1_9FIRM|nr:hypothetical protein KL86SPO_20016 [uncultured Sporomusa sp.]